MIRGAKGQSELTREAGYSGKYSMKTFQRHYRSPETSAHRNPASICAKLCQRCQLGFGGNMRFCHAWLTHRRSPEESSTARCSGWPGSRVGFGCVCGLLTAGYVLPCNPAHAAVSCLDMRPFSAACVTVQGLCTAEPCDTRVTVRWLPFCCVININSPLTSTLAAWCWWSLTVRLLRSTVFSLQLRLTPFHFLSMHINQTFWLCGVGQQNRLN